MYSGGPDHFAGSGFMPSQPATPPPEQGRKSVAPSNALFPLTVKQIGISFQNATGGDDNFVVDGQEVSNVSLVGMVFDKEEKSMDVTFVLDDGTGRIQVKCWIYDENKKVAEDINPGQYVKVHGHLRSFQNQRNVTAFSIRPIKDFNEITLHFLECIFVHQHNLKQKGTTGLDPTSPYAQQPPGAPPSVAATIGGNGLTPVQQSVLDMYEDPIVLSNPHGLPAHEVARKLGMSVAVTEEAINALSESGYIYPAMDDNYKSCRASSTL